MKILFLTLARIDNIEDQGIYPDLIRKFRDNGHEVTIVYPSERKFGKRTKYTIDNGVKTLSVWTPNIQKTNLIEKGITTLLIEYFFYYSIKKFVPYKDFDLILYSTPPITFTNLINKLKKQSFAKTYLLLKDIFPQNAIDLKYLKSNSFLYKYFRKKEKLLYKISDYIGCMSPANLNYILIHNPEINPIKVEVNPNTIDLKEKSHIKNSLLYDKYKIPRDKVIFIFGGNLGIPQGIDFLKKNINFCKSINEAFFLIVGDGTKFYDFENWIINENIKNAKLIKELPKFEYDEIIRISHVGLIFLNPLFTIPNFPSRILSYMQNKLPVICATDNTTDIGKIAEENKFGLSCLSYDSSTFFNHVVSLMNNEIRIYMGENGYNFLKKEYLVDVSYKKIIAKINI